MKKLIIYLLLIISVIETEAQKNSTSPTYSFDERKVEAHFDLDNTKRLALNSVTEVQSFLNQHLENLTKKNSQLDLLHITHSKFATHYLFQQKINGLQVYGATVKINVAESGKILSLFDLTVSPLNVELGQKMVHDEHHVLFPNEKGKYVVLHKLRIKRDDGTVEEILKNDQNTEMYVKSLSSFYTKTDIDTIAKALIFKPNPIVSGQNTYGAPYEDNDDNTNATLDGQRVSEDIKVSYLNGEFVLENEYLKIKDTDFPTIAPVKRTDRNFFYNRSESGFEDVMTIYHITTIQDYLKSIGQTGLHPSKIVVDPHGFQSDQSFATVGIGSPSINFGIGGVDDAEDAHVIVHEYGHVLSYFLAPGTNSGTERKAIDEAFGDYLASSYSRSQSLYRWHEVFSWDGHNNFWEGRTTFSKKQYPDDLVNNLYKDAEIWSATLMLMEHDIDRNTITNVLFESMKSYSAQMNMKQAAQLLIQADNMLNTGANYAIICHHLKNRGLVDQCTVPAPSNLSTPNGPEDLDIKLVGVSNYKSSVPYFDILNQVGFSTGNSSLKIVTNNKQFNYKIYAIDGKLLTIGTSNFNGIELSPEEFSKGTYIIQTETPDGIHSKRFIR